MRDGCEGADSVTEKALYAQVAGMAPQAVLDRMQSMAPMRPTETMAQQALAGGTGGDLPGACPVQTRRAGKLLLIHTPS